MCPHHHNPIITSTTPSDGAHHHHHHHTSTPPPNTKVQHLLQDKIRDSNFTCFWTYPVKSTTAWAGPWLRISDDTMIAVNKINQLTSAIGAGTKRYVLKTVLKYLTNTLLGSHGKGQERQYWLLCWPWRVPLGRHCLLVFSSGLGQWPHQPTIQPYT